MPALVQTKITAMFLPDKYVFFDLLKDNMSMGYASQGRDGLFYSSDNERSTPVDDNNDSDTVQAIMKTIDAYLAETDRHSSVQKENEEKASEKKGKTLETSTDVSADQKGTSSSKPEGD